ncbi:unnamed protein product [Cunninghamella blakesleeana]
MSFTFKYNGDDKYMNILNDRKTSASKKPLIKELIEKAHQTTADHPTATIINNNFNKGTLIQNNNVNNSQPVPDCFKNNTLVTLQQPEQQKQKTSEKREVNNSTNNKHHQNKKQKTDAQVAEEEDDQKEYTIEEIWNEWIEFLSQAKDSNSIHKYSPEKHGIIQCGKGISPRPGLNRDIYYNFMKQVDCGNIPLNLNDLKEYVDSVVDSDSIHDMKRTLNSISSVNSCNPLCLFIKNVASIMVSIYQTLPSLSYSESVLNTKLVFPFMNAIIDYMMDINDTAHSTIKPYFIPGEEQLISMTTQLERIGTRHDNRYRYNADGIIRLNGLLNLEIMILETSGPYKNDDNSKVSFDIHKAMFGLLSVLKTIADQFEYASLKSFQQLKVFFLHFSGSNCRIWSLRYSENGVYLFLREDKVILHQTFQEKDDLLLPLFGFFFNLKEKINTCINQLSILQQEHKENKRAFRHNPNSPTLLSKIIKPAILRLSQKYDIAGLADETPISSPGIFDYN